eukprot:10367277-Lingulodinium_polyedra.AAC.1
MAPPCGTASRARGIPVAASARAQGVPAPPPLRSALHPLGLPGLDARAQTRVEKANDVYRQCARVAQFARERGITFSIENPVRSYFWDIPFVRELLKYPDATVPSEVNASKRSAG